MSLGLLRRPPLKCVAMGVGWLFWSNRSTARAPWVQPSRRPSRSSVRPLVVPLKARKVVSSGPFGQLSPAADAVVGNVAEQQVVAAPDGAFGEGQAAGDAFQIGARLDQLGQASGYILKLNVNVWDRFGHGAGSRGDGAIDADIAR